MGKLGDLPIIVISHDPQVEIAQVSNATTRSDEAVDLQMQQELSELSTRGCLLIASGERALRAGCAAGYGVRKPAAARSEFTDGGGNPHVV
jgi:F420-dependent methylenetetrahydromethanopterin dehydrogenase